MSASASALNEDVLVSSIEVDAVKAKTLISCIIFQTKNTEPDLDLTLLQYTEY